MKEPFVQPSAIAKAMHQAKTTLSKNSPTILTGLSVAGLVTTVIFAVKATPVAMRLIEEDSDGVYVHNKQEIIKLTWKCYIPAMGMGAATIACMIGANTISLKRQAALASMYSLTEKSFKEYQTKVVETIGETKEQKIKDEVMQDTITSNPLDLEQVVLTGKGDQLCYDSLSGRYFKNDIEQIRRVWNDLNYSMLTDMWVSLNDFYYGIGLSGIEIGEEIGWRIGNKIEIEFGSMVTPTGEACLVLKYGPGPKHDYQTGW